jgi:hypothetical protein
MWTALPRGIDTTVSPAQARLSVLLSPRVSLDDPSTPGTLTDVPDLLDWPARLAGFQFTVEVSSDNGATSTAVPTTVVPGTLDSAMWQALLPGTIPVENRVFDQDGLHDLHVHTYSNSTVVDTLKAGYTGVYSSSPVALPGQPVRAQAFPALAAGAAPSTPLLTTAEVSALDEDAARAQQAGVVAELTAHARGGTLASAVKHAADLAAHLARITNSGPGPLLPSTGAQAEEMGRLLAFHAVFTPSDAAGTSAAGPGGFEPELHSIVTLLHEHPALLSRLGLLVDLTVPVSALPQIGLSATEQVQLRVSVEPGSGTLQPATTHYSPWTAFIRDAEQVFTPRPRAPATPEVIVGLLNLALPGTYSIEQVDADGSAIKATIMMSQPLAEGAGGLPAMRTTGPSLIRAGQGDVLAQRMLDAADDESTSAGPAAASVTLFAEDLTRGFRIDVRDHADGVWRSLHERDGTYSVPGVPDVTVRDEGVTQPVGALDASDPQQATVLRVHESLARWEGWSLSVGRPGQVVGDDGPATLPSTPQPGGVPLTSAFTTVPGSLPRLRFGRSYDVRARAVDLGGGGLDHAGADAATLLLGELALPPPVLPAPGETFTFHRFEPVPSPAAVPRERVTEGESAERLVIRSSRTESAAQLAGRLNSLVAAASPDSGARYLAVCERHLVPPKANQQTAERAGLLDALSPAAAYLVCCKDKGGLADSAVLDISTGEEVPLSDVADPFTGGTRPAVEAIAIGASSYPVHHEASLLVPYLPDWLAASAVLCDLPGVSDGQRADVGTDGSLTITASDLPPATLAPIRSVTTIPFTGTWPLLEPLRLQLTDGDGPPTWNAAERVLSVSLAPGRTATVRRSCALPAGALDVLAQWQWLRQARAASGQPPPDAALVELALRGLTWPLTPFREITLVHASQQPTLDPAIDSLTASRQPGDTGASLSGRISLDAGSTGKVDLVASWTEPTGPGRPDAAASAHVFHAPLPPDAGMGHLTPGSGETPDVLVFSGTKAHHEFGDTKHRSVTYLAIASTRFAEYFPAGVDAGPSTAQSNTVVVDVPSSAAPPAPRVREAVPMWRWDRPTDPALPRRRYGAGVRLLLEPPWYVSGEDEQLGVVLLNPAAYPPTAELRAHVTHWGADPAFGGPALAGAPVPASFPAGEPAVNAVLGWPSAAGSTPVVVVPHAVSYDNDRGAYVCDIPVEPGAVYSPFVRLAVVRYQPSSLPGLELSAAVQLPFIRVLPERRVTLTPPTPGAPDTYTVRVDGTIYVASGVAWPPDTSDPDISDVHGISPMPPLISVTVQERLPETRDEAGWTVSAAAAAVTDTAIGGGGLRDAAAGGPLWTGRVTLPTTRTPGQFRVLVTEYELVDSDEFRFYRYDQEAPPDFPPHPHPARETITGYYRPGSRRLVFAEELIV